MGGFIAFDLFVYYIYYVWFRDGWSGPIHLVHHPIKVKQILPRVSRITLKRFFIFHFILPFIICGFISIHVYYLHYLSSNNSLGYNINNFRILFFPFISYKDIFGLLLSGKANIIQLFMGVFALSHPDNAFQVNELVTPLHI